MLTVDDETRLSAAADASEKEAELLLSDLALLRSFAATQSVTIGEDTHDAKYVAI